MGPLGLAPRQQVPGLTHRGRRRRSGAHAGLAPKMLVRGDRGFPPRRELSAWLHVSALLCPFGWEKGRQECAWERMVGFPDVL